VIFTLVAVPFIVFVEEFFLFEFVEAVFERYLVLFVLELSCCFLVDVRLFLDAREMSLEVLIEGGMPMQIQNKIMFTSFVLIEAYIVLLPYLVKHV